MKDAAALALDSVPPGAQARAAPQRSERYFFSTAALLMLGLTFAGFQPFYLRGTGTGGRQIAPALFPLVLAHGTALTAWMVLFLIQSLLIDVRKRQLHTRVGWVGAGIATLVVITGYALAVQSVRLSPPFQFWGMAYRQFLLVMLAEISVFALFVGAAVSFRKRREKHRAMMLLATLSILAGATVRLPVLFPVFGEAGWMGIFGPIFTLGAVFLLVRSVLRRGLDPSLAAGYAFMLVAFVAACRLALSAAWSDVARAVFKI